MGGGTRGRDGEPGPRGGGKERAEQENMENTTNAEQAKLEMTRAGLGDKVMLLE